MEEEFVSKSNEPQNETGLPTEMDKNNQAGLLHAFIDLKVGTKLWDDLSGGYYIKHPDCYQLMSRLVSLYSQVDFSSAIKLVTEERRKMDLEKKQSDEILLDISMAHIKRGGEKNVDEAYEVLLLIVTREVDEYKKEESHYRPFDQTAHILARLETDSQTRVVSERLKTTVLEQLHDIKSDRLERDISDLSRGDSKPVSYLFSHTDKPLSDNKRRFFESQLDQFKQLIKSGLGEVVLDDNLLKAYFNQPDLTSEAQESLIKIVRSKIGKQTHLTLTNTQVLEEVDSLSEIFKSKGIQRPELKFELVGFFINEISKENFSLERLKEVFKLAEKYPDEFNRRIELIHQKFGKNGFKLLNSRIFSFSKEGVPVITTKILENGFENLPLEEVGQMLSVVDFTNDTFMRVLISEFFAEEEQNNLTIAQYFENLDPMQIKVIKKDRPELYHLYSIYRYIRFAMHTSKLRTIEELAKKFTSENNQLGLIAIQLFSQLDKRLTSSGSFFNLESGDINITDTRESFKVQQEGWGKANEVSGTPSISKAKLETMIQKESQFVLAALNEVREISRENVSLVIPNNRIAWIYEHLIPDWRTDFTTFTNLTDRKLFALEVALTTQEFSSKFSQPNKVDSLIDALSTIKVASEWLKTGKIDHFVFMVHNFKIPSGYVTISSFFDMSEKTNYSGNLEAAKLISTFPNLELVFIDNKRESNYSPGADTGALNTIRNIISKHPRPERAHFFVFPSPRDDITDFLDAYFSLEPRIETNLGKMSPGRYYLEKTKDHLSTANQEEIKNEINTAMQAIESNRAKSTPFKNSLLEKIRRILGRKVNQSKM